MLKEMLVSDVDQIVNVHLASFPGFFLTTLGPRFLRELYTYIASSQEGIGFVYQGDVDNIAGFVCGTTHPAGFYTRFFKSRWLYIIPILSTTTLRHPSLVRRLIWRVKAPPQASTNQGSATLMSIAVSPEYQCQGIGAMLVQAFLERMQQRNIQQVTLTTDRDDNDHVNDFYKQQGFHSVRSFVTPEGRWMNEYAVNL